MTQSSGVVMGGTVGRPHEAEEVGMEVVAREKARGGFRDVISELPVKLRTAS